MSKILNVDTTNAAEMYIASLQAVSGRNTMRSLLNNVAIMLGSKDLKSHDWSTLSPIEIEMIKSHLNEKEYSPNTINNYLAALRGTARQALIIKQLDHENYVHIKEVKKARGSRVNAGRALEPVEIYKFYHAFEDDTIQQKRDMAMFSIMVECGLRREDVVKINCGDINWSDSSIQYKGKGNKETIAYMNNRSRSNVEQYFKVHPYTDNPDNPLFIRIRRGDNPQCTRLSARSINGIIDKRRQIAGIKHFTPHDLRRSFATYLIDIGIPIKEVSDLMNHSNIATTVRYDKRKEKRSKELMRNFMYESIDDKIE